MEINSKPLKSMTNALEHESSLLNDVPLLSEVKMPIDAHYTVCIAHKRYHNMKLKTLNV